MPHRGTTTIDRTEGVDHVLVDGSHDLRTALVACYGVEVGTEAWAEAMVVGWERRAELEHMDNPLGYLFRVGQSKARPHVRWASRRSNLPGGDHVRSAPDASMVELLDALADLRPMQRAAVLLVTAHGFSYRHAADVLGVTQAAVTNHVHRGLARLRRALDTD
jgi:DNA-directed RNA polymerase specialized sigma24 family protein